jgi:integrating conjugative element protein (TIGR03761 family)
MSAPEPRTSRARNGGLAPGASVSPPASTADSLPGESPKATAQRDGPRQPKRPLLVDIAADTLTLHTREAYGLFAGRGWDAAGIEPRILGGQRAAAALNCLRHIGVGGNPYADWFLVCFQDQLTALRIRLAELVNERTQEIEALRTKGLALNVLGARQPLELSVAFGSSYGYAIAETVIEFDYYVRVVKTFVLKDRIRPDAGRAAIREIGRPLRRLFVRSIRWERLLRSKELRGITREDYLPTASESARTRVRAAAARVGAIPHSVLDGTIVPSHVERRSEAGTSPFVAGPSADPSSGGPDDAPTLL